MNHTAAEASFVDQLEFDRAIGEEGTLATSDHERCDQEVILVDQTGSDRLGGEVRAADRVSLPVDSFSSRIAAGSKRRSVAFARMWTGDAFVPMASVVV